MKLEGKVFKFGDNIDTDVIIPARYLSTFDSKKLAEYCMIDIDKDFSSKVQDGDIIVGGNNFGCGSSREHAPISIKGAGVSCVIAISFARIFFRNSINIGLPILECPEAVNGTSGGDRLSVDLDIGKIINLTTGVEYNATVFPPFLQEIIKAGGLMNSIKENK